MTYLRRTISIIVINFIICSKDIITNKLRTFITTFGIFLGIGSFLVNVAFIRAMDQDIIKNMNNIGGLDVLTVKPKKPVSIKEKIYFQKANNLSISQAEELVNQSPYLDSFLPQKDLEWQRIVADGKQIYAHVKSVSSSVLKVYKYEVSKGKLFNKDDNSTQNICIIGKQCANQLFGNDVDPIGKKLRIDRYTFTVTGLIHTETVFQERAYEIVFPYSLYASKFISRYSAQDELTFQLKNPNDAFAAKYDIHNRLIQLHRGVEDFTIEINTDKIKEMQSASSGIKMLLSVVAFISLLVGGISITNIMFASIGNRIHEIGIRKALGATSTDIFIQFVIEAILISAAGGIPGMLLGVAITAIPENIFPYNPQLLSVDYMLALFLSMLIGIVSGCVPAVKAGKMEPTEALRY